MGRRSATETAIAVMAAFVVRNTWEQAALARHVGVTTRTLRKRLDELTRHLELERDEESGRLVYWSVRSGWLPNCAALGEDDAQACARLLARLPKSDLRDRVLLRVAGAAAVARAREEREPASAMLAAVEDGVAARAPLRLLYESAHSALRWREVSPHCVAQGDRPRFVATCHDSGELRWFRVDRITHIDRPCSTGYRAIDEGALRAFMTGSASGYRSGELIRCRFTVRAPEARWVRGTLPVEGARVHEDRGGVSIEVETAGLDVLARFVVGLGDAAVALTPELREGVCAIADGALRANSPLRRGERPKKLHKGWVARDQAK
jgi:predicted DNA-binding transcriptional regulator YafY